MPNLSKPFQGQYTISANRGQYTPFAGQPAREHGGIDFAMDIGTPIYAIEDGTVIWSQWDPTGGGEMIKIKADSDGGETLFLHLSERLVSIGQKVKRAELIAKSGGTGNVSGPHLHFEFWKNIDPANAGITATDDMIGKFAQFDSRWAEPSYFKTQQPKSYTPSEWAVLALREYPDLSLSETPNGLNFTAIETKFNNIQFNEGIVMMLDYTRKLKKDNEGLLIKVDNLKKQIKPI